MAVASWTTLVYAALLATSPESYAQAHQVSTTTGRPMLVMVSASWCTACRQMEVEVLPKLRRRGLFGRVVFAVVDVDKERKLAEKLIQGGPIPQLILFRRSGRTWFRRRLIGRHNVETVEAFVDDALRKDTGSPARRTVSTPAPAGSPNRS
ncbi:MAG TPA: thioredoxin [Planctomycetes bacterium]|nr:thioredoxin [Planctomycetota bacterium]